MQQENRNILSFIDNYFSNNIIYVTMPFWKHEVFCNHQAKKLRIHCGNVPKIYTFPQVIRNKIFIQKAD